MIQTMVSLYARGFQPYSVELMRKLNNETYEAGLERNVYDCRSVSSVKRGMLSLIV